MKPFISPENDPYYLSTEQWNLLVTIITSVLGFEIFDYQAEILRTIMHYQRTAVVASRQIGKSVTIALLAIAWALHKPEQTIVIISTGERQVKELLTKRNYSIKKIYKKMEKTSAINASQSSMIEKVGQACNLKLEFGFTNQNAEEVEFKNGSRIVVVPCNPDTASGYTANLLIGDEIAKMPEWREMQKATFPAVSRVHGKIALFSSIKGKNHWYQLLTEQKMTEENPKGWRVLKYDVYFNPPDYLDQIKKDFTEEEFNEEFLCIPVDEYHSLFPFSLIDKCSDGDFQEWL